MQGDMLVAEREGNWGITKCVWWLPMGEESQGREVGADMWQGGGINDGEALPSSFSWFCPMAMIVLSTCVKAGTDTEVFGSLWELVMF
jgi:hypothetical protein